MEEIWSVQTILSGKPEWYLLTWGQESSSFLLQKSQQVEKTLTRHSRKDPDSNGHFVLGFSSLPLEQGIAWGKREILHASLQSTICSRSLLLKGGSTGLVDRGDNESTRCFGSAQNKTRKDSFQHSQTLHACWTP